MRAELVPAPPLRSVHALTRAVCLGRPTRDLFDLAIESLLQGTTAESASVLLFDAAGVMRFVAWRGISAEYRAAMEGHGPWPSTAIDPPPLLVPNVLGHPATAPHAKVFRANGIWALAFVPLYCGKLLGKFMLHYRDPHPFEDAEVEFAGLVADQLAFAVQRAEIESRLVAANAQLDGILRHVGEGIVVHDEAGRLMYINDAARRMFLGPGRDRLAEGADETTFLHGIHLFDADGRAVGPDQMPGRRALATGAPVNVELRMVAAGGGEERWVSITSSAIPSQGRRPALAVSAIRDVTEAKAIRARMEHDERRLSLALAAAREAERRKDEFLAVLGHELRNPLSPIVTALRVMEMRGGAPCERERSLIERQVVHLRRLVDDLLDVSRITSGKLELARARVEVAALVSDAVELTSPLLEERGHGLSVEVPERGLPIYGDPTRLTQVLVNLLTNAARYTDRGGQVHVEAHAEGDQVVITVRDDGIGMADEALPRVFDLFVQGSRNVDRSRGGLGLGLTIVRRLVELHGGTVTAASEGPGKGSTFTVRLPRDKREPAPVAALARDQAPLASPALRVLVVDDNIDAAATLTDALDLHGHAPTMAHDGPTALELAARQPFDVGVLDIGLPAMDGYELARRLLADHPGMRLVAVTGYGQPGDRERSREAGFARHLVKPVDLDDLLAALTA